MLKHVHQLELFGRTTDYHKAKLDWTMEQLAWIGTPPSINVPKRSDNTVVMYYLVHGHSSYVYLTYFSILSWAKCTDLENVDIVVHTTTPKLYNLAKRIIAPLSDNIEVIYDKYRIKIAHFDGSDKYEMIQICDADCFVAGENKTYFAEMPVLDVIGVHRFYLSYGRYLDELKSQFPKENDVAAIRENKMRDMGYNVTLTREDQIPHGCIYLLPRQKMKDWPKFCNDFLAIGVDNDEIAFLFYCNHYDINIKAMPKNIPLQFYPPIESPSDRILFYHPWNREQSEERRQFYLETLRYFRELELYFT